MPTEPTSSRALLAAGRPVHDARTLVRRYCGLEWAGNPPETWAFDYFDRTVAGSDAHHVGPVDVLATSALHQGLSRADLAFFKERAGDLDEWLGSVPPDASLAHAGDDLVRRVQQLAQVEGVGLGILSKVLHAKRPALVPMVDRPLLDRYRPVTGERRAEVAWLHLVEAVRSDLRRDGNAELLEEVSEEVSQETGIAVSALRTFDIATWMDAR